MSYCINSNCQNPQNEISASNCASCGTNLVLGAQYRALKLIGQSGFGRTFLAIDELQPFKPRCVIKQYLPANISSPVASKLFQEQTERLRKLGSHPQIPTFLDSLEAEKHCCRYIVQEFIAGRNLEQELMEKGAFNEAQIRQLLMNILPVLEFVHEERVIHRDVKPENIIRRSSDNKLVLVDFSAAKYAADAAGTALIKTGTTIGSASYTAPEQLMGKAVFQSDLYSLGVICVHLLTQVEPFDLVDSAEGSWVWRDYLSTPISNHLGSILDKLLERGIRKRYTSARAVLDDISSSKSSKSSNQIKSESKSLRSKVVTSTGGGVVASNYSGISIECQQALLELTDLLSYIANSKSSSQESDHYLRLELTRIQRRLFHAQSSIVSNSNKAMFLN